MYQKTLLVFNGVSWSFKCHGHLNSKKKLEWLLRLAWTSICTGTRGCNQYAKITKGLDLTAFYGSFFYLTKCTAHLFRYLTTKFVANCQPTYLYIHFFPCGIDYVRPPYILMQEKGIHWGRYLVVIARHLSVVQLSGEERFMQGFDVLDNSTSLGLLLRVLEKLCIVGDNSTSLGCAGHLEVYSFCYLLDYNTRLDMLYIEELSI